jgi:glutaredoxin/glutathione-dependent peroxiredoxin
MTIRPGDVLPDATLTETTEFGEACPVGPQKLSVAEQARGKKIVVFGLPGAYTPTCSAKHLPGYVAQLDALKAKGVDEVWCVSVNDGFVMAAWGKEHGAIGKVRMLGDGGAELTRKLGLDTEIPGMGVRSRRYSLLVEGGVVQRVNVEEAGKFAVSNVETMLEQLG